MAKTLLLASLTLTLSACSLTTPKPVAYQASSTAVLDAIARMTPTLSKKLLNEPFRVIRRTPDQIVVSTPLPAASKVLGLIMGAGISSRDVEVDFRINEKGGLTYLTYTTNGENNDTGQEVIGKLDKQFVRAQF